MPNNNNSCIEEILTDFLNKSINKQERDMYEYWLKKCIAFSANIHTLGQKKSKIITGEIFYRQYSAAAQLYLRGTMTKEYMEIDVLYEFFEAMKTTYWKVYNYIDESEKIKICILKINGGDVKYAQTLFQRLSTDVFYFKKSDYKEYQDYLKSSFFL